MDPFTCFFFNPFDLLEVKHVKIATSSEATSILSYGHAMHSYGCSDQGLRKFIKIMLNC